MPGGGSKPGERRGGRKKGTPNKVTTELKTAIMHAFDEVGGESYLVRVAQEDPRTFCTLLGKVLPSELKAEISGNPDAPLVTRIELVPLNDNSQD
ncbi:hypothetical protein [Zhongshania sp.]|uniref:hypothetical protein n=1 Tax=Zhongshania sp. TaxID=1971902 RepID=UPI0035655F47